MTIDTFGSNIEELKEQPKIEVTDEDVQKVKEDCEYSNKLYKANSVLHILDFPSDKEEPLRKILLKQENTTLDELAWKSKKEIFSFLINEKNNETVQVETKETKEQKIKNDRIDKKLSSIKSVFTNKILSKNPDIEQNFEALSSIAEWKNIENISEDEILQKEAILEGILTLLKLPWTLETIIKDIGWVDKNNPKYVEFRDTLIWLDSSFKDYFDGLEHTNSWANLNTNEIINSIEKDSSWTIEIDLNSSVSKMSLTWSPYSFDEEIDKQALSEIMDSSQEELNIIKDSLAVLKEFWVSFDTLLSDIQQNWWKENFKQILQNTVNNFSKDVFSSLDDVYEQMDIKAEYQIKEYDISSFTDINSPNDLKLKIENIKEKFSKIESQVWDKQTLVLNNYQTEVKELIEIKSETKEKQLKVLEFMKNSGFDLIPKDITDRIIEELKSNTLIIPWLDLSVANIDLKNWNFWESWAFFDKEAWLNIGSKTNLVKFMNKLISWDINEPLSVEAVANWVSVIDPAFLDNQFLENEVASNMGWNYSKMIENLKIVA